MSSIAEHLCGQQPSHARTNHNHPPGLRGPVEAQGHDSEQLLIVGILHALLEGVVALGSLPVQGGRQAEEDGDQGEEAPGWGEEGQGQRAGQWVCGERKAGSAPSPAYLPKECMSLWGRRVWVGGEAGPL